jgi:hypothetical protein
MRLCPVECPVDNQRADLGVGLWTTSGWNSIIQWHHELSPHIHRSTPLESPIWNSIQGTEITSKCESVPSIHKTYDYYCLDPIQFN